MSEQDSREILIVDDNEDLRALLEFILKRKVFSITQAINGEEALKLIGNDNIPSLVLLDIIMPYRDGFEILEAIKENEKWKDVPVVMLTARHETNKMERAFKMGIDHYVTKPFKPETLLAEIKQILEQARA